MTTRNWIVLDERATELLRDVTRLATRWPMVLDGQRSRRMVDEEVAELRLLLKRIGEASRALEAGLAPAALPSGYAASDLKRG